MVELCIILFLYFMGMFCFFLLLTTMGIKTSNTIAKLILFVILWPILILASLIIATFQK